jgi:hypothetical protein
MQWRFPNPGSTPDPAAAFRRVHERWLTWALRSSRPLPVIPTLRVDQGGFDALLRRPGGRAAADEWWENTLAGLDGPES